MVAINNLDFQFRQSDFRLKITSLDVADGERVAIVGPSGSGKTTLLHLIAGILMPDRGTILMHDHLISSPADSFRRAFRITKIGLVFQSFELVSYLTVYENILLPYRLNSVLRLTPEIESRAEQLASETGIAHRLQYFPHRLSQGEKQRVAICRAMLPEPPLLLADEPTGNLDPAAKQVVVDLLLKQLDRTRATLLLVTHDSEIAARFPRTIDCRNFAAGAAN